MPVSNPTGWSPQLDAYEPSLVAAKEACARFVADMERGAAPYWLTLVGVTGCGKTMLLKQVLEQAKRINPGNPKNNSLWPPLADEVRHEGVNRYTGRRPYCIMLDEATLTRRMRQGEYDLPDTLQGDFFVGLDEIGIARDPTNFISEAIGRLAEVRMGSWTMFATNFELDEIADRMDDRISARMVRNGNKVIVIEAKDYSMRP